METKQNRDERKKCFEEFSCSVKVVLYSEPGSPEK